MQQQGSGDRFTKPDKALTESQHLLFGGCGIEDGVGVLEVERVTCNVCREIAGYHECGEPSDDGSGRVCRRICAPGKDYHGGGHLFADPALDGDAVREATARWIATGEQPEALR